MINHDKIVFLNFNGETEDLKDLSRFTQSKVISFKMNERKTSGIPIILHKSEHLMQISLFCGTETDFAFTRKVKGSKKSLISDGRFIKCHLSRFASMFLLQSLLEEVVT